MLTHLDEKGRPKMVDVGGNKIRKIAVARGSIQLSPVVLERIQKYDKKGDVLSVAQVAGL